MKWKKVILFILSVMLPDCDDEIDSQSIAKSLRECLDDHLEVSKDMPSFPAGIVLSLETDEGISKVIDLDEEEERNKRDGKLNVSFCTRTIS